MIRKYGAPDPIPAPPPELNDDLPEPEIEQDQPDDGPDDKRGQS